MYNDSSDDGSRHQNRTHVELRIQERHLIRPLIALLTGTRDVRAPTGPS